MKSIWIATVLVEGLILVLPTAQAQTYTRTDTITYEDSLSLWVIGQPKSSTNVETGLIESRTVYDPVTALPIETYAFEKLQRKFTYDLTSLVSTGQRGTLKTMSDGRDAGTTNTTVTLSNWKRGTPQGISYPDTGNGVKSKSAVVGDFGQILSVTNEIGAKTCYGYDSAGRVNKITYPSETTTSVCDISAWNDTKIVFELIQTSEYGIPAGHWRRKEETGNYKKLTYYDAMWRPIVTEDVDITDLAGTNRWTATRYDADGRVEFTSYPRNPYVSGSVTWGAINVGTHINYDVLGRQTEVKQDSELGLLTTATVYQPGFNTAVTNPGGKTTTTTYKTYDQPTMDWPVTISQPEGVYTDIDRNVFGNPKSITRRNATSSVSSKRSYVYYPGTQDLCKTVEPETKSTVTAYDAAGNVSWSASGLDLPNTANCDIQYVPANTVVSRTYDQRNRLATLTFPDGLGDQIWSYTDDSLPSQIITYNGFNHTTAAINAYSYNKRRLLGGQGESISQDGWYTWAFGYGYDRNGNLSTHVYPGSLTVDYAPNALGQPRQAGTFAAGVSYYPNGAVKQFTYGNLIVHTMTPNARLLPDISRDEYGTQKVVDDGYYYDHNANVVAINDGVDPDDSRDMSYDNLDRLKSTTSAGMFGGTISYTYDVLDNIETLIGPGRNLRYCYDATTKALAFIRSGATNCSNGSATTTFQFDNQGNLAQKNGQAYDFDYGNRLRGVTGLESYRYDGHGRRILAWSVQGLGNITSMYSMDGALRFQSDARRGKAFQHVYLAGSLVASREYPLPSGTASVKYQHTDALGTPVAVTDAARNVIETSDYEPYGKLLNRPIHDGPGYTGHVEDAATGLTYMQQRYYDPSIGRFLSVDPVTANSGTGANFNRYWYANNNPYKYTDPDGRYACLVRPMLCYQAARRVYFVASALAVALVAHQPIADAISQANQQANESDEADAAKPPKDAEAAGERIKELVGEKPTTEGIKGLADKGWEWKGKPGEAVASDKGAFVNPETGEQVHNDLDSHESGSDRGPHVTYTDSTGKRWDHFPEIGETIEQDK